MPNDCLSGGQLHYDWDKITVTRLNESHLTYATTPLSVVTLRPWPLYAQVATTRDPSLA